jgi:hypothetical protein
MIWLTWRQHRRQALFTAIAVAALAALMIPTGLAMRASMTDSGAAACVGTADANGWYTDECRQAFERFTNQWSALSFLGILFLVLPVLVGLFWGAPLVAREVEQGTHRLVWTQGVSRRRWAAVKFGVVGLATAAVAVGYGLGMLWWWTPFTQAGELGRFQWLFFDMQGVAPIGYTAFAVALGVFAGSVWPRLLPAMGVTLVGFIGVRIVVELFARPRYQRPETLSFPVVGVREPGGPPVDPDDSGDWMLATQVRNPDGSVVADGSQISCPPADALPAGRVCGEELGLKPGAVNWREYQPADRFWDFQYAEAGLFVALAVLLLLLAFQRVRRIT